MGKSFKNTDSKNKRKPKMKILNNDSRKLVKQKMKEFRFGEMPDSERAFRRQKDY